MILDFEAVYISSSCLIVHNIYLKKVKQQIYSLMC